MKDYKKYINALRKCAKEHDNDRTFTGNIIVSDLCRDTANLLEEVEQEQKSGKWDRLYNWLNDMRLGIAPDETVDDIDERHCREAQTDILDEIMEWMIKAESEE